MAQLVSLEDEKPTFRKAKEVILARNRGGLEVVDIKVLNYLTHRAMSDISSREVHRVSVKELLVFLGHSSTSRLTESLSRLGKANIDIDYKDEAGKDHTAVVHYLSYDMTKTEDGYVVFAFDPLLVSMLADPAIYGTLNIRSFKNFRSAYSMKLYEILSLYVRRQHPVWNVKMDELREALGVEAKYAERADNFKSRIIEASVDEINSVSDFRVSTEYIRGGRGGRIQSVKFTVNYRPVAEILAPPRDIGNPIGRGKNRRDSNTLDLLDGRTDLERGAIA